MRPVHGMPHRVKGIALPEGMVFSLIADQTVGIVHPVGLRSQMPHRPALAAAGDYAVGLQRPRGPVQLAAHRLHRRRRAVHPRKHARLDHQLIGPDGHQFAQLIHRDPAVVHRFVFQQSDFILGPVGIAQKAAVERLAAKVLKQRRKLAAGDAGFLRQLAFGSLQRRFALQRRAAGCGFKYTRPGGLVRVALHEQKGAVRVAHQHVGNQVIQSFRNRLAAHKGLVDWRSILIIGIPKLHGISS